MSKIKKKSKNQNFNISFKKRLLWVYFILIIIPLGSFSLFSNIKVTKVIQDQTFSTASKTFNHTVYLLEETLGQLENTLDILSKDPLIYQMASLESSDYDMSTQLKDADTLELTFTHLKQITKVDNIQLYVQNDFLYSEQNRDIFQLSTINKTQWFDLLLQKQCTSMWFAPQLYKALPKEEKERFSLVHVLYNPTDISQLLALLRADINKEQLIDIIAKTPVTENSSLLLMDNNQLLFSSSTNKTKEFYDEVFKKTDTSTSNTWNLTKLCGEKNYIRYAALSTTGWNMVSVIPYKDVFGVSEKLFIDLLFSVFLVGIVSYLIAYAISGSSLKRISTLTRSLHKVQLGDVTVILTPEGNDEIGQMMFTFNNMMDQINILMKEKEENGKEIKNLELKALQAQINPHFLYNSLDLINCTAIEHDVPQIVTLVNALAKFYKLSLNRGCDTISIADELMHTKLYVKIQNLRFNNKINLEIQADEELLNYRIIKIVLQPIVENSIIHGIFEKEIQTGTIAIIIEQELDDIVFTIKDDGIGMRKEIIEENFSFSTLLNIESNSNSHSGYGVSNINDRLKLAYGLKYGISCTSQIGIGTIITFRIPKTMSPF